MNLNDEKIKRWRLILGQAAEKSLPGDGDASLLSREEQLMDAALSAIYEEGEAGLGSGGIHLSKWLGDVRSFFPEDVVSVIQSDAIQKKGLTQLLFEPETLKNIKPSIEMVAALMALKGQIPEHTKETARELVKAVVEDIKALLATEVQQAVKGAVNRTKRTAQPGAARDIDWKYTINRNLKNYDAERKIIIPERIYFFDHAKKSNHWHIILDIDQSGSMADSVIYASIIGSIFASIPALKTNVVAFDDTIVDLSESCQDPVDMLFGIQLGGGTDINKSLAYCGQFITDPEKTIFILISDLYEGGNQAGMMRRMKEMKESGVRVIALLALSDKGIPDYDESNARKLASMGIPCFGCTPTNLPELLQDALEGKDLGRWAGE
ncbi:VWA domain-containing protein [Peribacillus sp. SCS-26]|uniref:VWA domain-containing protein n=1 Tax=Paraperibacillus marinus TaxID=3115295 RepID=UPI0039062889